MSEHNEMLTSDESMACAPSVTYQVDNIVIVTIQNVYLRTKNGWNTTSMWFSNYCTNFTPKAINSALNGMHILLCDTQWISQMF